MFDDLQKYLKDNLPSKVADGQFKHYENFGKGAENLISDTIFEYFNEKEIRYIPTRAVNKNDFPNLK